MTAPVRLADLPPAGRRIIAAMLAAQAAADKRKAAAESHDPATAQEARRERAEHTAA